MNQQVQDRFLTLWTKYFPHTALPFGFYFTDQPPQAPMTVRCVMSALPKVRRGETVVLSEDSIQCFGAKAYLGYDPDGHTPSREGEPYTFTEQFLSTGVPGAAPGEAIKQSPQVCRQMYQTVPAMVPPAKNLVFKRWDRFSPDETPQVVIFYVKADALAGLYNLVNYDRTDQFGMTAPWGSGCSSVLSDPYLQIGLEHPNAILGMVDIAARPFASGDELSLSMPMERLLEVMDFMEGSFLDTPAWETVRRRMAEQG